ncbi:SAM-dependent methyltransferase [Qipengyuania sp. JC766]|uniref:class I SAM-dependent methyltransferase n=1 Tax=Qipengyuania sp. JC766 TaxID=3232139 RepID=UPI00345B10D7
MTTLPEPDGELAEIFRRLIRNTGPISLVQFMGESNARYYATRDPLGGAGDFVTAPEISQMFGELIGLWLADMWINSGREEPVSYVELGPGRGTLAKDALRAMKRYGLEPAVHFVETSRTLREVQLAAVPQAQWHDDVSTLPWDDPLLVVANEFFDALPVRQLVRTEEGWRERMIALDGDDFVFVAGKQPMDAAMPAGAGDLPPGSIVETCPAAAAVAYELFHRLAEQGGCALVFDYGAQRPDAGSTLQAVRAHRKVDPFETPGSADLTAHVDFGTLANIAESRGLRNLGTVGQGDWLRALGVEARAQALAKAAPHYAEDIDAAMHRLIDADQMGRLFKAMGVAHAAWPGGAGFAQPS